MKHCVDNYLELEVVLFKPYSQKYALTCFEVKRHSKGKIFSEEGLQLLYFKHNLKGT
jgi:hypothetical protein